MKKIDLIDHSALDSDKRVVFVFRYLPPNIKRDHKSSYYLLDDVTHYIWASKSLFPAFREYPSEWMGGSIAEFPKAGLQWFIEVLECKFFKTEKDGGLERGAYTVEEDVNGERLVVARMMGTPGYSFRNYSRNGHTLASEDGPQCVDLSEHMLFDEGLFEQLKSIIERK